MYSRWIGDRDALYTGITFEKKVKASVVGRGGGVTKVQEKGWYYPIFADMHEMYTRNIKVI